MGLRNLPLPMKTVEVADGVTFTVRGFSPNDALGLYHRHRGELSALFDQFTAKAKATDGDVDPTDIAHLGANMVSGAPRIMAEIVAVASGSKPPHDDASDDGEFEADVEAALNLSAGVQMDALQKVADLTFTPDMPPGKFLAVVVSLAQSATASMTRPAA